ncbi:hypothetical protein DYB32_008855 [Aphanomyces invadans]|uniref:Uncharacterized protein n=1 Tax=Aphanomyces invadans TaxID=157072 RepID=A0A3R6V513_9STRA|nr:hypothetical protein DYB32_008855 [Aphanomyces invadans]
MRKYRSQKKEEFQRLEAEWKCLEETLKELQRQTASRQVRRVPGRQTMDPRMAEVLAKRTSHLRGDVDAQYKLACCLRDWVASQPPTPGLTSHTAWIHSSLRADPDARRVGLQWLSEKLYHTSHSAVPHHPLRGAGDAYQLAVRTNDGVDAPITIVAIEFHFQFDIVFVPFETVVGTLEAMGGRTTFVMPDMVALQTVESVGDTLRYSYGVNARNGVSMRRVTNVFRNPDGTRAVMTSAMVADDERFPLGPGEIRSHGFGWYVSNARCRGYLTRAGRSVAERVADSITTVRGSMLHYTPFTTDGVISLEHIGQLFGVDHHDHRRREDLIAHVQTQAEAQVGDTFRQHLRALRHHFMQTPPSHAS